MRDDAVAPIIAVMLILAALVTFLVIYEGMYIPSLKESAEIDHLEHVEESFMRFSSDAAFATSSGQSGLSFAEPVQLGGGDVVFDTLRSSGSLEITNENEPVYTLTLSNSTGTMSNPADNVTVNGTIVDVSYKPQDNFWQDQGYEWQYGYVNVTKYGGKREAPLGYPMMDNVTAEFNTPNRPLNVFASNFMQVKYTENTQAGGAVNCSQLDIWAVNMSASPDHSFVSSNGYGTLKLTTTVDQSSWGNITEISLAAGNMFGNASLDSWNDPSTGINASCPGNIGYDSGPSTPTSSVWNIRQDISPLRVILHNVNVEISAY
jgi:hypothetical protein